MLKGVNWIAVIVTVVLLEAWGYVYYGPLMGARWQAALGHTPDMSNTAVLMSLGVVNTLVIAVGLGWLTSRLGAASLSACVGVSLAAWFFFDFTTQALEYLYMGMSQQLVCINMAYQLSSYLIAGVVFSLVKFGRAAPVAA